MDRKDCSLKQKIGHRKESAAKFRYKSAGKDIYFKIAQNVEFSVYLSIVGDLMFIGGAHIHIGIIVHQGYTALECVRIKGVGGR